MLCDEGEGDKKVHTKKNVSFGRLTKYEIQTSWKSWGCKLQEPKEEHMEYCVVQCCDHSEKMENLSVNKGVYGNKGDGDDRGG